MGFVRLIGHRIRTSEMPHLAEALNDKVNKTLK